MASVEALPNLGPKSRAMLAAAGIDTLDVLRRIGAVAAYARVRRSGANASLNLLWALEGALCGLHWRDVAREHRTSLLAALEAYEAATATAPGTRRGQARRTGAVAARARG